MPLLQGRHFLSLRSSPCKKAYADNANVRKLVDNENKGLPVCEWLSDPIFEPGNDLFDACEQFSVE